MKSRKRLIIPSLFAASVILPVIGIWAFFSNVNYADSNRMEKPGDSVWFKPNEGPLAIPDNAVETENGDLPQPPNNNSAPQYTAPQQQTYTRPEMSAEDKALLEKMEKEQAEAREQQRQSQCNLLIESYPIYVNQQEAQHQRRLDNIGTDYRSRGMGFSGAYQAAIADENTRHQQNLNLLQIEQNAKLAQYSC